MHSVKSAISLSLGFAFSNLRLARNRSGRKLGPTHSALRSATPIMITDSDSPVQGSRMPNQLLDVLVHTIAISGLSCMRTETSRLPVILSLTPHPVQTNG